MKSNIKIIESASLTFSIEIESLLKVKKQLGNDFVQVVECLSQLDGRVVITGLGKSAIIAQKIVATLNSTGTPAMFMHAADAVHGDLGMLKKGDVLLCLSKSGNTSELKVLIPLVKQFGNQIIGMTSNEDSFLAREADIVLYLPIEREADPNNLAPTTSTTVQLVMGDALAICLLANKGFTPNDFSKFHPGGSIGKQLYMKVSDIYIRNDQPYVSEKDNLKKIIISMTSGRLGITVVINDEKIPKGVVTDGDLRRMLEKTTDLDGIFAEDIMSLSPRTINRNALAMEALNMMRDNEISQLVVVGDEGAYMGIVHLHDLVAEGII